MKLSNFLRRSLALLALLAIVLSLLPVAFAAEEETGIPKELQGKDLVASYDESGKLVYTEADESVRGAMRASSFNEQATQDFSAKPRVAFFIDNGNSENSSHLKFTISNANIDNLVSCGVTDFFVMTKTKAGSFSTTNLKNVISYAASSVKVYAWMHTALDNAYIKSNNNSAQYHFSVGRKCNAYATSHDLYDTRNGYVDLSLSAYKTYFNGLVDQVEACTGVDGILLDSVKWGGNYYGWDTDARTAMGKTAYNAAVTAMAKHEGYTTSTDSSGYKVWKSTNTANADYTSLTTFCNDNSANAQKYMNYRSNAIKGFVDSVRSGLGSSLYLGVAIEPDWDNSLYTQSIFGQFPGNLKTSLKKGFCVAKTFLNVLQSYGTSYYGTSSSESLGSKMAKQIAKLGCNVFIGFDGYWTNNSSNPYIWYDPSYYQSYYIHKARFDVNGNLAYGGDILGAAVYTAGCVGIQKVTISDVDTTTPDMTVKFCNPNIASYGMLTYFHKYNDTDAQYNMTKAGVSAGQPTNYGGTMTYYPNTSSGYNYCCAHSSLANAQVAAFATGGFKAPVKNFSLTYNNLPFARIGIYDSGNSGNSFDWLDIIPMYSFWVVGDHTSCSFTETVKVVGTCVDDGYSIMKCNTCGYSYIKTQLGSGHSYGEPVVTPATCTTDGSSVKTCTSCGNKETTTIAATGHTSVVDAAVAATCTSTGLTEGAHCSVCQAVLTAQQTVPMLEHTVVETPYIPPTCTTTGSTEGKMCSVCGTILVEATVIAPDGHDTIILPAVEATCDKTGLTEGEKCLTCGEIVVEQEIIEAFGHDYVMTVVEPTCVSNGYTNYTCDICGYSFNDDEIPMSGHDYDTVITPPTCEADGFTTNTCLVCGHSYISDTTPATDHDYVAESFYPTCTEQGYTTYTCCECGASYNDDFTEPYGHDYVMIPVAPTCTEQGYNLYVCDCGDEYKEDFVDMIDHSYVYTESGEGHAITCENCDYEDYDVHTVEGGECIYCEAVVCAHTETTIIVDTPATCTESGMQHTECANCGEHLGEEVIEATGHDTVYYAEKAATCEENGNRAHYYCPNCEVYFADEACEYALPASFIFITALGHDYEAVVTEPTCTEPGFTTYTCANCDDSYTDNEVEANGHDHEAVVTEPTCTEGGYTTYTCTVCGEVEIGDKTLPLDHVFETVVTEPTCTEEGYTTFTCTVCGTVEIGDEVEANGHDHEAVVTDPTCTEGGYTTFTCTVCGAVEIGDEIEANGHDHEAVVTEPTCTEGGYTTFTCTVCGTVEIGDETPKLGHDLYITESQSATCEDSGIDYYACRRCDYTEKVLAADPTGHDYTAVETAPTCTEAGFTTYTCGNCGHAYTEPGAPALDHSYNYIDIESSHIVYCSACDYSAEEPHNFVNGFCVCGAQGSNEPQVLPSLAFNMDISAGAEMVVNYNFMAGIVSSYSDFYLEIKKDVAGSDPIITTYGMTSDRVAMGYMPHPVTGAPLMYNASYAGINAKEMGDNFATTLYVVDENGTVYRSETVVRSIKDYLTGKINDENSIPEMKTMGVDMLNYGAAAQVHFGYDTENLVNADLTEEQLAYATTEEPVAVDSYLLTGDGENVNTNITVGSKVEVSLSFIYRGASDVNAVKCVVTDEDGEVLAELKPVCLANIMFSAKYDNVGAREMRKPIKITFYEGDKAVSKTVTWSVESYVAQVRARNDATAEEIAVVNAMLVYGDSVAAYMEATEK